MLKKRWLNNSDLQQVQQLIGLKIQRRRQDLGITQEKLAEKTGCYPTYIGEIERGVKTPPPEGLVRIAIELNTQATHFMPNISIDSEGKCYFL